MKKPIDVQLTPEGYQKIKDERANLVERRPGVVTRLTAAREQGDLSENAGYHAAKDELGRIDSRIREIDFILRYADVVLSEGTGVVSLGNEVSVKSDFDTKVYTIVGELEADPASGKISKASPIGKALMGKMTGETVEIETPGGKIKLEITSVNA